MKISLSSCPGYRPPSQSFLPTSSWGQLLQNESVLVDIPIIDRSYYGDEIDGYKEELGAIGVMFEYGEACQFVEKHLMSLVASSTLTSDNVVSILKFIKFLKDKFLSTEEFISSIRLGKWLKTSLGYRSSVGSVLYDDRWRAASQISDIPFIDQDYYGEEILSFKTELQMLGVVISFGQNYQLVSDHLKSPAHMKAQSAESGLFILQCVQLLKSSDKFVQAFKDKKFLKTNMGYMSPVRSYLLNPAWGCLLQVFDSFPSIDQNFYGNGIFLYKNGLKQLGVVVDFEEATRAFARVFRQQLALSSISKENVLLLLACYRKLQGTTFEFPKDLKRCIREVKWVRTCLGDYRVPRECFLFGPDWESISPICLLPFIDDTDNCYGKGISEFKEELRSLGVVLSLKDGCRFVAAGLSLHSDPSRITPAYVYSLLDCVCNLQQQKHEPLPDSFLKKIGKEWLKTNSGYRTPEKCLLFDFDWNDFLRRDDGPFVDEVFYGSKITSYAKELSAIGVTVEVRNGCRLLASHLCFHSKFNSIIRIYNYLKKFNWEPDSGDTRKIWIPNGSDEGEWVNPGECVLFDKDNIFGKQLKVLAKHYEIDLLGFFLKVLGVKRHPSLDDYCLLWKQWECSRKLLSPWKCYAFWKFVANSWSPGTQKTLEENLLKLPVHSASGGILLHKRQDVFIADDLQLKDLFEQRPIFVWFPQLSLPSLPRSKLLEVYSKIGVRNISECVRKEEISITVGVGLNQGNPRENLIGKALIRLILAFLAGPSLRMEENRHEAVRCLLNLTVIEIPEPIKICYSLSLSSGENLKAEARPLILWDRKSKKLLMQKMDRSGGQRSVIEYATYFSEAIAGGLLWDKEDRIDQLAELIKLGFLVEFDEYAIGYLMKTKNLQLFLEDDGFLSSAFPSK
ncbi:hypothetical protein Vadar_014947 [Vaccinium darrowii]|uniref:Uncharacterized protein n=1 Tax=Vaccinium darrowii TaxID=229202 RepID=A0ACB7YXQ5_9ERIC|nr:hypothetical protein Vadar_014947 [Vaccinium darrowii]